jgi:hypothetical protein
MPTSLESMASTTGASRSVRSSARSATCQPGAWSARQAPKSTSRRWNAGSVSRDLMRSPPGLPIRCACRDGCLVEGVHGRTVVSGKRDVDGVAGHTLPGPELRLARLSEPRPRDVVLHDQPVAERGEGFHAEAFALLDVRCGRTDVIQHRAPPAAIRTTIAVRLEYPHGAHLRNGQNSENTPSPTLGE